jgi:hypothetical protein
MKNRNSEAAADRAQTLKAGLHSRLILLPIGIVLLSILTSGCAFTRTTVAVNYSSTVFRPLGEPPASRLIVGEVGDTRTVSDKYVLCQKYNGYGQRCSGAYVAREPVANIYRNGLIEALEKNGFMQTNAALGDFILRADIQDFDHDVIVGFWTATVKPKLTVRFELVDAKTGISVWHDTLIGKDSLETAWGTGQFLVQTFNRAADSTISQLISDSTFRNYVLGKMR